MKWRHQIGSIVLSIILLLPTSASGQQRAQQITSSGGHATAIGVVNGNVNIVRGVGNPAIDKVLRNLRQIKAGGTLSAKDLDALIQVVNDTVLPMLGDIKDDTGAIRGDTKDLRAKVDQILELLGIAAEHPSAAPTVLRDFLKPAFDLSNKSYDISAFLDANGTNQYKLVFSLAGECELYIDPPRGAGFTVGYGILSDHGTRIFAALLGTQPHYPPLRLPGGIYQFVMTAKREAGQYNATISSRCS